MNALGALPRYELSKVMIMVAEESRQHGVQKADRARQEPPHLRISIPCGGGTEMPSILALYILQGGVQVAVLRRSVGMSCGYNIIAEAVSKRPNNRSIFLRIFQSPAALNGAASVQLLIDQDTARSHLPECAARLDMEAYLTTHRMT